MDLILWDLGVNRINNVTSLKVWFFNSRPGNVTQSGNLIKAGTDVTSITLLAGLDKWHLVDFGSAFIEFQSIEFGYESGNYLYFGGIEVNGRLLVDGPAINDTIESTNLVPSTGSIVNPEYAFDGTLDNKCYLAGNVGDILSWSNDNYIRL